MRRKDIAEIDSVKEHDEKVLLVRLVCDSKDTLPGSLTTDRAVPNHLSITRLAHLRDVFHARAAFRAIQFC
jgi:hypothetical protein